MIYLIRHGQTKANLEDRFAGWTSEPLTKKGRQQAKDAAQLLNGRGIAIIYSSPLPRTLETSWIISDIIGAPVTVERGICEIKIPAWDGRLKEELKNDPNSGYSLWKKTPYLFKKQGAEDLLSLQKRAVESIKKLADRHECPILVVTHLAVMRVLILYFKGIGLEGYRDVKVANATPLVLCSNDGYFTIKNLDGGNK